MTVCQRKYKPTIGAVRDITGATGDALPVETLTANFWVGRSDRPRRAALVVGILLTLVLSGCADGDGRGSTAPGITADKDGSGNPGGGNPGGGNPGGGNPGGGNPGGGNPDEEVYSFYLPEGDISVSDNAFNIYVPLREHKCGEAQENLVSFGEGLSRRDRQLFQTAIELCFDRRQSAQGFYSQVPSDQWVFQENAVTKKEMRCLTYRAVRSVLDRQPQDSIPCPVGRPPEWEE